MYYRIYHIAKLIWRSYNCEKSVVKTNLGNKL